MRIMTCNKFSCIHPNSKENKQNQMHINQTAPKKHKLLQIIPNMVILGRAYINLGYFQLLCQLLEQSQAKFSKITGSFLTLINLVRNSFKHQSILTSTEKSSPKLWENHYNFNRVYIDISIIYGYVWMMLIQNL